MIEPISYLTPNLPKASDIQPWLEKIDDSHFYSNFGPLSVEFEQQLIQFLQAQHHIDNLFASSCANGTSALSLALLSLNLNEQARVLVPNLTFIATASAIQYAKCDLVIADVDTNSWSLTPEIAMQHANREKIDAVVVVCPYGHTVDVNAWDEFYEITGIPVILDAAAAFANQTPLAKGLTVFSLHATKLLGIGEGGLIIGFKDSFPKIDAILKDLSNFSRGNLSTQLGFNAKLSEYHAAVGLAALPQLDKKIEKILQLRHVYAQNLQKRDDVILSTSSAKQISGQWAMYYDGSCTVAELIQHLQSKHIETRQVYIPLLSEHRSLQQYPADTPIAKQLAQHLLCLPLYDLLTIEQVNYICEQII